MDVISGSKASRARKGRGLEHPGPGALRVGVAGGSTSHESLRSVDGHDGAQAPPIGPTDDDSRSAILGNRLFDILHPDSESIRPQGSENCLKNGHAVSGTRRSSGFAA